VLDIDSTDDPTHGAQEGTAYHGYYRPHMYHPLLVFDGETDQRVVALLRPGDAHASRGVLSVLCVLIRALRARWPGVTVEIRADAGCAVPALYDFCEPSMTSVSARRSASRSASSPTHACTKSPRPCSLRPKSGAPPLARRSAS